MLGRGAEKTLMLILTDGRPSDVDAPDARLLHSLDAQLKADAYVAEIFARPYTVVERLPGRLPQLFMTLTT